MAEVSVASAPVFVWLALLSCTTCSCLASEPANKPVQIASPDAVLHSFPLEASGTRPCRLDLSDELFGGVKEACTGILDRSRSCPVLAAWLYAAHARSSLQVDGTPRSSNDDLIPTMPEDSQGCIDSLGKSLDARRIIITSPNETCDAMGCLCGIRLHNIGSLSCPAAFILTPNRTAAPTSAVRDLEKSCANASYSGCTTCLRALQKVSGRGGKNATGSGDGRTRRMMERDCELMGLTWLLSKNKTAYVPTVSAVLRAMLYTTHGPEAGRCSPDQDNMPLAAHSAVFDAPDAAGAAHLSPLRTAGCFLALFIHVIQWSGA